MEVHITGDVTLQPLNTGVEGTPVTAELTARNCIICAQTIAGAANTGADGKFYINFTFDSTLLKNNALTIYIPNKPGTLSVPYLFNGYKYVSQQVFPHAASFDTAFHFQFYAQANVNVRLLRTQTDVYTYFGIGHSFTNFPSMFEDYITDGNHPLPKDTTFQLQTAAGVYTTVTATKTITLGNAVITTDSIKCTQNGNNMVTINY